MRPSYNRPLVVSLAILLSSCGHTNPIGPGGVSSTDSLIAALRQQGADARRGETLPRGSNPFFSTNAQLVIVNDRTISVFEYASAAAAGADAAKVSPDGSAVGNTMITWVASPHFYKAGALIVIYAGTDDAVLGPLEQTVGKPFAYR
jgi:hypothetical protein